MDTKVTVTIVHVEVIPNHITDALTEALPNTFIPAPILTAVTHHTGNLHHTEAYQLTPEITAGPEHTHHTNLVRNTTSKSSSRSSRMTVKPHDKQQKRVTIDNVQLDFYSSDDTSSDSDDDFN